MGRGLDMYIQKCNRMRVNRPTGIESDFTLPYLPLLPYLPVRKTNLIRDRTPKEARNKQQTASIVVAARCSLSPACCLAAAAVAPTPQFRYFTLNFTYTTVL